MNIIRSRQVSYVSLEQKNKENMNFKFVCLVAKEKAKDSFRGCWRVHDSIFASCDVSVLVVIALLVESSISV